MTEHLLLEDRVEHSLHCRLYILDGIVDDLVEPHIDVLLVRCCLRHRVRTNVESDDDRIGCGCKADIGLVDGTDTAVNYFYYYLFVGQFLQTLLYSLHRTLYICLNNNIQFLDVTGLNLREQIIQRHLRLGIFDQTVLAFGNIGLGKCSCLLLRIHGNECLACLRYR